mmetsp:Transcript_34806/g.71072  ORF Transcript_34806/g.71072 Transcript_34806/m.71072 type:complete len:341 (+) Transcript_34806:206-1228(+)
MIIYNNRSEIEIILRFDGSALKGIGWLWVIVLINILESTYFVFYGAPEIEGKAYLDILGKVLVFLLVFRSNLAYDRFWSGRVAIGGLAKACFQMVSDVSVFVEKESKAEVKFRHELYRLALSTYMCMNIHIRKMPHDLARYHAPSFDATDNAWLPEAEARHFEELLQAGVINEEERQLFLKSGLSYVTVAATLFSQKIKEGFQDKIIHRNLMIDVDGQMKKMISAWYDSQKIAHYPFPFPYIQALSVFNLIFVVSLPVTLVQSMGPWTPLAAALITVGFLGLDAVGSQLEDPFGTDVNDLDLDTTAQNTCDACFVALRARDGKRVKPYSVLGILAAANAA